MQILHKLLLIGQIHDTRDTLGSIVNFYFILLISLFEKKNVHGQGRNLCNNIRKILFVFATSATTKKCMHVINYCTISWAYEVVTITDNKRGTSFALQELIFQATCFLSET